MLFRLFENFHECEFNSLKIVYFSKDRYKFDNIFEESEQHLYYLRKFNKVIVYIDFLLDLITRKKKKNKNLKLVVLNIVRILWKKKYHRMHVESYIFSKYLCSSFLKLFKQVHARSVKSNIFLMDLTSNTIFLKSTSNKINYFLII